MIFSEDLSSQLHISSSKADGTHKNVALDEKYLVSLASASLMHLVSQLSVANQKGLNKKMQWSYQAASTRTLAMTPQQLLPAHNNG